MLMAVFAKKSHLPRLFAVATLLLVAGVVAMVAMP